MNFEATVSYNKFPLPPFLCFLLFILTFYLFFHFIFLLLLSRDAAKSLRAPIKARRVILASISAIAHRVEFRRVHTVRASRERHRRITVE